MSRFNLDFNRIFGSDMNTISDDVSPIQLEINADQNERNFGTRLNHKIMTGHDEIMELALTPRQL